MPDNFITVEGKPIISKVGVLKKYFLDDFSYNSNDELPGLRWDDKKKLFMVDEGGYFTIQVDIAGSLLFCCHMSDEILFGKSIAYGSSLYNMTNLNVGDTVSIVPKYDFETKLWSHDHETNDDFGKSICMTYDGLRIIVGAEDKSSGIGKDAGAAYIFVYVDTVWTQEAKLIPNDLVSKDEFGNSVAIDGSGKYALVGAESDDIYSGSVYVYKRLGFNWIEQAKLTSSKSEIGNQFGSSVALSDKGEYAIVGSFFDKVDEYEDAGTITIFKRDINTWSEQARIEHSDVKNHYYFGTSVALSGDGSVAVVGAPGANTNNRDGNPNTGAIYILQRIGINWIEHSKLRVYNTFSGDAFGMSVDISDDGKFIVSGAPGINYRKVYKKKAGIEGYVMVWKFDESKDRWNWFQRIYAPDRKIDDIFGFSTVISGDSKTLLIAAERKNNSTGAIYLYKRNDELFEFVKKIVPDDANEKQLFGSSLGISYNGTRFVAGSEADNDLGGDSGSAYIYNIIGNSSLKVIKNYL